MYLIVVSATLRHIFAKLVTNCYTYVRCKIILKCVVDSLAEIPECHMKIASNKAVLKQLIAIMSCHDFREIAAMISMGGMLCLSYR